MPIADALAAVAVLASPHALDNSTAGTSASRGRSPPQHKGTVPKKLLALRQHDVYAARSVLDGLLACSPVARSPGSGLATQRRMM